MKREIDKWRDRERKREGGGRERECVCFSTLLLKFVSLKPRNSRIHHARVIYTTERIDRTF